MDSEVEEGHVAIHGDTIRSSMDGMWTGQGKVKW